MFVRSAVAGACVLALTACATVFNGTSQAVSIKSVPDGANVTVTNADGIGVHTGTTPVTLQLRRGRGYFKSETYKVVIAKPGYANRELTLNATVSGWYVGNLLIGGLIGFLAVDPLTGAMYTFPGDVNETLAAETPKTSRAAEGGITIVSTESLSAAQLAGATPVGTIAQAMAVPPAAAR